jgi:putative membrane protein
MIQFLFGAVAGSLYAMFDDRIPLHRSVKGSLMGLAVWSGSYLGWIPAFGILTSATKHPWRRNMLMIVAHLIWGVVLGMLTQGANTHQRYIDLE